MTTWVEYYNHMCLLGPETEVKQITSEIITQCRRVNSVSTYRKEVRESLFEYIF